MRRARTRLTRRHALALLSAAGWAPAWTGARAQAPAAAPLRELLGMAAADLVASDTREILRYIDVANLRALGGDGAQERTVQTWPRDYFSAMGHAASWPATLGFAAPDVAQLLELGSETARAQLFLAGRFDRGAIEAALRARGFAAVPVDGATVWRRRDDDGADLGNEDRADPFGGPQGRPARLALLGGRLAFSTTDAGIALAVAAAAQRAHTVLDYDEVATLASAAEVDLGDGGTLVQAVLHVTAPVSDSGDALARMAEEPEFARLPDSDERRRAVLERPPFPLLMANPLPHAPLALLGERRSAAGATAYVALCYEDEGEANEAAVALAPRIAGYFPLLDPARPNVVARARGSVRHRVVATPTGWAALVAVATPGSLTGAATAPFAQWLLDLDRLVFWPLWTS